MYVHCCVLCVSIRLVECPACRNAFVEWVRASAEAYVSRTRHDDIARVSFYSFRPAILRSEIRAFAYNIVERVFSCTRA